MISRITGSLASVSENRIELQAGNVFYEVLIPTYLEGPLRGSVGDELEMYIHHYIEGGAGASAMIPRLVGFLSHAEREFFLQLIKVPGLGARKTLKAMAARPENMALAIEKGDKSALSVLPGLGKRTADKVIASLQGKVSEFAALASGDTLAAKADGPPMSDMEEEALLVLSQVGYKRGEAEAMIKKALKNNPGIEGAEELVRAAFRESGKGMV